ncbi:hypothetical protein D3C80_1442790 [compost metagenome]
MLAQYDTDSTIRLRQQPRQFQDAFAWNDHLVLVGLANVRLHGTHGQTMTVGCDGAHDAGRNFQQHPVEVITYILLSHGKAGAFDQAAQLALLQAAGQRTRAFLDGREVIGRQRR